MIHNGHTYAQLILLSYDLPWMTFKVSNQLNWLKCLLWEAMIVQDSMCLYNLWYVCTDHGRNFCWRGGNLMATELTLMKSGQMENRPCFSGAAVAVGEIAWPMGPSLLRGWIVSIDTKKIEYTNKCRQCVIAVACCVTVDGLWYYPHDSHFASFQHSHYPITRTVVFM